MRRLALLCLLATLPAGAVTLTSQRLTAELDDVTGMLLSLTDRTDGLALALASPDRYALQPDPKTEFTCDETTDQVTGRPDQGVFQATNSKLPGVVITKRYTLTDRWLAKRVEFKVQRRDVGLLKYTVTTTAAPEFYADGYLPDPSRHPMDYPYLYPKDLTSDRPIRDSHSVADHHWAIYTSPAKHRGLAQYRFKVDDRYVHPLSSYAYEPGLTYGPKGWRVAVACKWLSTDRPTLSAECRWQVFDGDHLAFQREYLNLPEAKAEWDWDSPAWMQDVKGIIGWTYGGSSFNLDNFQEALDATDDGIILVMIGGVFTNTRNYLADPLHTPYDLDMPSAELRAFVDKLHALSPRLKVGGMTWQWAFGPLDPVYREHPEWTVHDGDGKPVFAATGWTDEKVYSQNLTPECLRYDLEQFRGMVKRYDFDFIYMDTGQGGVTRFDWSTHYGAQDYDWADLYKGIRDAARSNRDGITFFNGTPRLYSQYADCGYFEGMGFVKTHTWQAMADRLLLVKFYQPDRKWTMPLYWREDNGDQYLGYCYLLGIKPGGFGGGISLRRWPLVQAANELTNAELVVEADARPCWWQETTDTECYALRIPGGAMLNAWWHGTEPTRVTTSCLLQPLGLEPGRPVHAWLYRPKPVALSETIRLTEHDANEWFRKDGSEAYRALEVSYLGDVSPRDGRIEVSYELQPDKLGLVLLTQEDQLAYAVDGRPTQFLLPVAGRRNAKTVAAGAALPAELTAHWDVEPAEGVQSPELVPERSAPETVNKQVREVGRTVAGIQVDRLWTIDCEHNRANEAGATMEGQVVRLVADMGDHKLYGFASAAVESSNLGRVSLRVTIGEPHFKRFATTATAAFVGLTADYHTSAGYTRRVRFGLVPCRLDALQNQRPWWGLFDDGNAPGKPYFVDLTDQAKIGRTATLDLDLGRCAPDDWDGRVLFGPVLESCGLGAKLTVELTGNAPAGAPDPKSFSPLPVVVERNGVSFQGASIAKFESGAKLDGNRIAFPPEACVEGAGLQVITWQIQRDAESKTAQLMVNFQLQDRSYKLVYIELGKYVAAGSESKFDLDLNQFAPEGWNGRVRMRLRGDHLTAALIANSTFQLF